MLTKLAQKLAQKSHQWKGKTSRHKREKGEPPATKGEL